MEMDLEASLGSISASARIMSFVSYLSGSCNGTSHVHRMKVAAAVVRQDAAAHRCLIVSSWWNIHAQMLQVAGLLHKCVHISTKPSTMGSSIRAPYVENEFCYDPKRNKTGSRSHSFSFRGSIHVNGREGTPVRLLMDKALKHFNNVTITNIPRNKGAAFSKDALARELLGVTFALVPAGDTPESSRFYDAIACGCIPVVISDKFRFAFSDRIDYSKFVIRVPVKEFLNSPATALFSRTSTLSPEVIRGMQRAIYTEGGRVLFHHPRSELVDFFMSEARQKIDKGENENQSSV
jgi:hypothetical protein